MTVRFVPHIIAVLLFLNLTSLLLLMLKHYEPTEHEEHLPLTTELPRPMPMDAPALDILDPSTGELDIHFKHVVHAFSVTGSKWAELSKRAICLATQTSVEHMYWVATTSEHWRGPISVAVFVPDIDYQIAVHFISYLRQCFPHVEQQVTFHLVYPTKRLPQMVVNVNITACDQEPWAVLQGLLSARSPQMMLWREQLAYPQNLLRNVARRTCPSAHIMCTDVDMIPPSGDMADELDQYISDSNCPHCAYVVPVYEIDSSLPAAPINKSSLVRLVRAKFARQFHIKVFTPNQGLSKLSKWEQRPQAPHMGVLYNISKFSFLYEPIYVAQRNVPWFDERFVGFGMTRNTQAYEMFLDGWTFRILNNAFLVHWGFQLASQRPPWRLLQQNRNNRKFPRFVRELAVRYDKDPLNLLHKYNNGKILVSSQPKADLNQPKTNELNNQTDNIMLIQQGQPFFTEEELF